MNKKFSTQVEHLYVSDGMLERLPHNQTAVPTPKSSQQDKGALFVLSEVQGHISNLDLIEKRLVTLTRDAYFKAPGGITASLRHATQVANQWLFQYNATTHEIRKAIAGGLVAVVLNGEDLFVAQIGPTALFVTLTDYTTRYPEESTWLDPVRNPNQEYSAALGLNTLTEPNITHLQMESGDLLVLADGRLSNSLDLQKASQIIQGSDIKTISQKLVKSTQLQHGSAMVIQVYSPEAVPTGYSTPPEQPVSAQAETPNKKGFAFAMPMATSGTRPRSNNTSENKHPRKTKMPSFSMPRIPVALIWKSISAFIVNTLSFLGNGLQDILRLLLPGSSDIPSASGKKQPSRHALTWVAFALPVLIILTVIGAYLYQNNSENEAYTQAITDATQKYEQAVDTTVNTTSRSLLLAAEASLQSATDIRADSPEITALQTQIDAQKDIVNNVKYFYYVRPLNTYEDIGANLKNVVQHNNHIYVLDAGLGRVFHHRLSEQGDSILPPDENGDVILQQGAALAAGGAVGAILDIVWMPAGGNHQYDSLLIVTENALFEYEPQYGFKPIPIAGIENWIHPVSVDSFYGNLYILDEGANQIYRYLPTPDGYSQAPENYFADTANINLSGAVDMTIDGAIYVLYGDGTVKKFENGEPQAFALTGLDTSTPIKNPTAIFTTADDEMQHLYITDSGNQRIIQLNKDGKFIEQLKPEDSTFENLQNLFVNEGENKMYVLDNNILLVPHMPVE